MTAGGKSPWITVVGLGEDGLDGISAAARAAIDGAQVLVGGERHLDKVPERKTSENKVQRLTWKGGFRQALDTIATMKGRRVVVLASGDPMFFGAGSTLSRRFDASEFTVIPAPGSFSLAAARMGWPLADVETLTVHGRQLEILNRYLTPGARLLVLSQDGDTPARAAALMTERGFGPSTLTVLEHMGGEKENLLTGGADTWSHDRAADLNTMAIECRAGAHAQVWSHAPGLAEEAFEHDGQITKREVRAATLAALAPLPGQVLWDVGAGSGAVAIEWLRLHPSLGAVAVERHDGRAAAIRRNADTLGVPGLKVVTGTAPDAFSGLKPRPEAIFLGGGVSAAGLLEACWQELGPGGRLVANAVTTRAESRLLDFSHRQGGALVRIAVSRHQPVGGLAAFKPFMQVTQMTAVKEMSAAGFQPSAAPLGQS